MRILVTGATGFLGSYLVADLLAHGHEVGALIRPEADAWRLKDVLPQIVRLEGSFDDLAGIRAALKTFKPEAVAHLAWRGVAGADRNNPMQMQNVADAAAFAAACAEEGATTFVGAGSQAEYGPYPRAISEDDPARPTTLYGQAKLAAMEAVREIAEAKGQRLAWLRVFSTYGPRDADHWLIPSLIRTLRSGERLPLTRCEQLWGFLHARDAAAGFRLALEQPAARGIFNLGAPEAPPLRETVLALRDLVNPSAELGIGDIPYRDDQVMILKADVTKLAGLGWHPNIDLLTGLRETAEWYVKHA
ncbi:NAD(P)-dependent oxidoreductase [Bradyrhizobium jicamae]|uniref:NAD-dependent epimerase/dehydratase family protein n=1 Tax=Bradyrhizobium jicamae TaxID=280332 RepID=UPI001BA90295|nr:NAD(P)-dependent oxidoreductase [Bradyrhizobium jicamae]MBR0750594.1 NAD(P)-dependent oxidoreductase [Bradyrhizobium jicamae]